MEATHVVIQVATHNMEGVPLATRMAVDCDAVVVVIVVAVVVAAVAAVAVAEVAVE